MATPAAPLASAPARRPSTLDPAAEAASAQRSATPAAAAPALNANADELERAVRGTETVARVCVVAGAVGLVAMVAGIAASVGVNLDSAGRDLVGIVGNLGFVSLVGSLMGGAGTTTSTNGKRAAEKSAAALNQALFDDGHAARLAAPWDRVLVRVECPSTYTDADPALHLVYDSVLLNREASASDLRAVYEALRALAAAEPAVRGAERLRIRLVPR